MERKNKWYGMGMFGPGIPNFALHGEQYVELSRPGGLP